ncbi:hypothetical protein P171DRAFT_526416 [Karstenula rhodostoma CBS 690.94]|uniref:Transglycosylase SLT domain-containing protein n=1 Tax=Karstenula rhodostoma CBS 690.94 TaxID=1392251 RepID=A0A9P4P7B4_9PLEO|nr:hypothetical protein P171DRAFT_526416 [Karstenula rhodostoma CBS 690.94]
MFTFDEAVFHFVEDVPKISGTLKMCSLLAKTLTRLFTILVTACFWGLSSQHPVHGLSASTVNTEITNLSKRTTYRPFSGPAHNFPDVATWTRYDYMWNLNLAALSTSGNTPTDTAYLKAAIDLCANQYHIDRRLILGIIMQESRGNVGVITTYSGSLPTAGLMQCSGCPGFPGQHGLSQADIASMVCGGAEHFKTNMLHWGDRWSAASVFPALREYNSGNVNEADLSDGRGATASYVSDLANRVTGWAN